MGSVGNPDPWAPYKDCSQGLCSIACPQWCYFLPPPPPLSSFDLHDDDSGTNFSPLIIAVIGILASAFLLVSYYTLIAKYCKRRRDANSSNTAEFEENDLSQFTDHEPRPVSSAGGGLDEKLIKSISILKYKKGDAAVEGTDCSVCLSEFEENESLRLLPKCSHPFHVPCIDTWLKSHSTCPLCRSVIQVPPPPPIPARVSVSALLEVRPPVDLVLVVDDLESGCRSEEVVVCDIISDISSSSSSSSSSPKENLSGNNYDDSGEREMEIRRSVSMDSCGSQGRVSIADILQQISEEDYFERQVSAGVGSSKVAVGMKRSISSGRFSFTRHGIGRNSIIPNPD